MNNTPIFAIQNAIETIGKTLAIQFPDINNLTKNELSDEISFE